MRFIVVFLLVFQGLIAQNNIYNVQNNYGAGAYDVVAYFSGKAVKGSNKYVTEYKGVQYRFSSSDHLNAFKREPENYLPQYGGWCAYAMATKGDKVKINPKTFEVRNGKLYLFYNAYFDNTYEDWLDEGPEDLLVKADKNWKKFL